MKPKWKREAQKARRLENYGTVVIRSQPPSTHAERRQGRRVWRQISRDWRVHCRPNRKRRRTLARLSRELVTSWRGWRSAMREYPAGPPPFAVEGIPEGLKAISPDTFVGPLKVPEGLDWGRSEVASDASRSVSQSDDGRLDGTVRKSPSR